MAHSNCDSCGADYDFTPQTARIHFYYEDPQYAHLTAKCGNGHEERIYLDKEAFFHVLGLGLGLPMTWWREVHDEVRSGYDRLTGCEEPVEYDGLPEVPRDWLINLHDTLRVFGGES